MLIKKNSSYPRAYDIPLLNCYRFDCPIIIINVVYTMLRSSRGPISHRHCPVREKLNVRSHCDECQFRHLRKP